MRKLLEAYSTFNYLKKWLENKRMKFLHNF